MVLLAKIAGFKFETTLDLFFLDNPEQKEDRVQIEDELRTFREVTCSIPDFFVPCLLLLIKE